MRRLVLPVGSGDRAGATPRRPDVTSTALDPDRLRIVLAAPSRAGVAGAAVVAGLPTGRGVPVVAGWDEGGEDGDGPRPWATPRTRRAVAVVQGAGVDAVATGNTVRVVLPADETQAVAAVERLTELPDRGPLICVVARAWNGPFLRLVERRGTVSVSGPSASVAACRTTLHRHGVEVVDAPRPTGAVATALLRAGWTARGLVRTPTRAVADAFGRADVDRVGEDEAGQALLLVLLGLTLALILAGVLGAVAMATSGREDRQRAVDVAALAAAAHLRAAGVGSVTSSSPSDVRGRAVAAARSTARENGAATVEVDFPQAGAAVRGAAAAGRAAGAASEPAESTSGVRPTRVRVRSAHRPTVAGVALGSTVAAIAEVATPTYDEAVATGDEYAGPLAIRQGKPMRPDVAQAFDRMNAAATVAGHPLTVTSGYRSNAEQARLFAAHPDPKWVARPGTSLHRMGTELDLGPPSAYGWLAANSERFGFRKRYSWE